MKHSDTDPLGTALLEVLRPLAAHARARGLSERQFLALARRATAAGDAIHPQTAALPYEVAVRIVGRWGSDPTYTRRRKPLPLPINGRVSFSSLVRRARGGNPSTALRALQAAGTVVSDRAGRLRLAHPAYVPGADAEKLEILGRSGGEFLKVIIHNLTSASDKTFLQRTASYDNIGSTSLTMLRRMLRREGQRALQRASRALAARDRDRNPRAPGGRRTRVSFGVYYFDEPVVARTRR